MKYEEIRTQMKELITMIGDEGGDEEGVGTSFTGSKIIYMKIEEEDEGKYLKVSTPSHDFTWRIELKCGEVLDDIMRFDMTLEFVKRLGILKISCDSDNKSMYIGLEEIKEIGIEN
jgi:hypothetical protein